MNEMRTERSLVKGILAGVLAGVAATAAKAIAEKMYAPREERDPGRQTMAEDPFSAYRGGGGGRGRSAFEEAEWGFGIAAGAAYGALAEFYPSAATGSGKTFGLALMTLTHESALPSLEMPEEFEDQPDREQTSEAAAYLVFGTVAEQVRSYVRELL